MTKGAITKGIEALEAVLHDKVSVSQAHQAKTALQELRDRVPDNLEQALSEPVFDLNFYKDEDRLYVRTDAAKLLSEAVRDE